MSQVELKKLVDLETGRQVRVDDIATQEQVNETADALSNFVTQQVQGSYAEVFSVTKDGMGFPDRTSILEFNDSTQTVTIKPDPDIGYFDYYFRGQRRRVQVAVSYTLQPSEINQGLYISFDEFNNLVSTGAFPDFTDTVLCFYVYYNQSESIFIIKGDERHSASRDTQWHYSKHREDGMVVRQRGALSFVLNDPSNLNINLGITTVADEDLEHTIIPSAVPSKPFEQALEGESVQIPQMRVLSESAGYTYASLGLHWLVERLRYNPNSFAGAYSWSLVPTGKFVNYFLVATHCTEYPIKLIAGRVAYDTEIEAGDETLESLGLNFPEIAMLYRLTFKSDTSLSNAGRCTLVAVSTIARGAFQSAAASADDHSNLLGRSKPDQHPASSIRDQARSQDAQASLNQLFVALAEGFIPSGGIMMYTGSVAPAGWAFCDGTNGTPDLRNRFIRGAGNGVSVGDTGGAFSKTTSNGGAHSHTGQVGLTTLTQANLPAHHHRTGLVVEEAWQQGNQAYAREGYEGVAFQSDSAGGFGFGTGRRRTITSQTGSSTAHNHQVTVNQANGHTHDVDVTPPFYALAFIMKL